MTSIVQDWAAELGLRHQGVLVSAVRGCDSIPKEDPMKDLVRYYRACLLRAHVGDPRKASSYMIWVEGFEQFKSIALPVLKSFDHYPTHFMLHFLHASEIIGYKGPYPMAEWWRWFYKDMVRRMHLNVETEEELDRRLNANEAEFAART